MKNNNFNVEINQKNGYITSIVNNDDKYEMNWCTKESVLDVNCNDFVLPMVKNIEAYKEKMHIPEGEWGKIYKKNWDPDTGIFDEQEERKMKFVSFSEEENKCISIYESDEFSVTVTRYFNALENLVENYKIKNTTPTVITINRDNFGIEVPFADSYPSGNECMTNRCNTHIWCGHNVAWVNALKMGDSDINLGLFLTKGAIDCYDQNFCKGHYRGKFILEPESLLLNSGEEYELEWELFWHSGTADFFEKIKKYSSYIGIRAKHFTVFGNEPIEFIVIPSKDVVPVITIDGEKVDCTKTDSGYLVTHNPQKRGEHIFKIKIDNVETWAKFTVKADFKELVENRIRFIVKNQQCLDKKSPLYGSYMVYDNDYDSLYFDYVNTDHNACRERTNIALFLMKYLQKKEDKKVRKSLELYMDFLFREFYEEKTGEVFNNIGKHSEFYRPYNAPGIMLVFCEMYLVTKEERYLDNAYRLAEAFYEIGGKKCYTNGLSIEKVINAFKVAGREKEAKRLMELFKTHTENIISHGTDYPPHECNYEQSIVAPALRHVVDMGLIGGDKEYYLEEAKKHLICLERFSGMQPDYRLNEVAIRWWDDYHFGKNKMMGDTLPHHLSVLTSRGYIAYYKLSGEKIWLEKAEEGLRNCMCLIDDDGRGHAAYTYPYKLNGKRGECLDPWFNDQDLVLYDALDASEFFDVFEI